MRTPHAERKELAKTQGAGPLVRAQLGALRGQTPYLVGLGLHGHHGIERNHEDHHGDPGQDGGTQVLRKGREQRPSHRASPG